MSNNTYRKTVGSVFAVVAVVHALRALYGWDFIVGYWHAPIWISWVAVVCIGWLAWNGFKK